MKTAHLIYFSPAYSTEKIVKAIGEGLENFQCLNHNITQKGIKKNIEFLAGDVAVIGVPVYSGRIPVLAAKYLTEISGNGACAIIVCVYGNRDYDDALLELKNICVSQNFEVISAGAFIARHSIFPKVAQGRPDMNDLEVARKFGKVSIEKMSLSNGNNLNIKGNFPYRIPKSIPLIPKGNKNCNECGTCVKKCPTDAIDIKNPRATQKSKCISCTRCIEVCPQHARHFGGLFYKIVAKSFLSKYSAKKDIELIYPNNNGR